MGRKIWLAVRNWTDQKVRQSGTAAEAALLPAFLPAVLVILWGQFLKIEHAFWIWSICVCWFVCWNIFAGWRLVRHLKEVSLRSDRHYDRVGKYDLPPEYADSESATKAKRRRK